MIKQVLMILLFAKSNVFALIVHDPAVYGEALKSEIQNTKRHVDTLKRWQRNFQYAKEQINQLNKLKEYIGKPSDSLKKYSMNVWDTGELLDTRQFNVWKSLKHEANADKAFLFSDNGVFRKVQKKDKFDQNIPRNDEYYKRHNVVEGQYEHYIETLENTDQKRSELQNKSKKLNEEISAAQTESDILVLQTKQNAIAQEQEIINRVREEEYQKLSAQSLINTEMERKEERAQLEEFLHYNKKSKEEIGNWMDGFSMRKKIR